MPFRGKRADYSAQALDMEGLSASPFDQLQEWLENAGAAEIEEPEAMCLATSDANAAPSSRMVLLRGLDERGLVFFTNYNSRKGLEIGGNPRVGVNFWWPSLHRQVRVEGLAEKTSAEE